MQLLRFPDDRTVSWEILSTILTAINVERERQSCVVTLETAWAELNEAAMSFLHHLPLFVSGGRRIFW